MGKISQRVEARQSFISPISPLGYLGSFYKQLSTHYNED